LQYHPAQVNKIQSGKPSSHHFKAPGREPCGVEQRAGRLVRHDRSPARLAREPKRDAISRGGIPGARGSLDGHEIDIARDQRRMGPPRLRLVETFVHEAQTGARGPEKEDGRRLIMARQSQRSGSHGAACVRQIGLRRQGLARRDRTGLGRQRTDIGGQAGQHRRRRLGPIELLGHQAMDEARQGHVGRVLRYFQRRFRSAQVRDRFGIVDAVIAVRAEQR
jgi:hypothetical protein